MNPGKEFKVAIFASGNGTNAEAVMLHFKNHPSVSVVMLLTNNASAPVINRASKFNLEVKVFSREEFRDRDEVVEMLKHAGVTHIVLAGFLWLVPPSLVKAFPDKIINIHPSLLPKFGGKGMYGAKVHEAVRLAGETVSGITIHSVNEHYDEGKIIFQAQCDIAPTDTAEVIAEKIHALEYEHFPKQIERWIMSEASAK